MDLAPLIHQLPPPFDVITSRIVLEDVPNADYYLLAACVFLICLASIQLRAFSRPPPVPLKKLPRRPVLQVLFKPDDISSSSSAESQQQQQQRQSVTSTEETSRHRRNPSEIMKSMTQSIFRGRSVDSEQLRTKSLSTSPPTSPPAPPVAFVTDDLPHTKKIDASWLGDDSGQFSYGSKDLDSDVESEGDASTRAESPFLHSHDLPDSFAPLLSSSLMEVLYNQLTADLVHAVHFEGGVRIREGRHEIPLDKDNSRPQLVLDVPKSGCRITAVAAVGSDRFSSDEDLDVTKPTSDRSKPMVKHAGLVLDPPLPLANVAPTLIHFPTLFEDNFVPTLRRIQIMRLAVDFIISVSSFIEKILWIIESKCQICLSKVRVTPIYKGISHSEEKHPDWRLSLAFSGHILFFGIIPVPFISVTLPTFIIPQPHALLQYLLTSQPLASAKIKRERIDEDRIALSALETLESWNAELKAVATPPALSMDLTLPGGVTVALEMMHGRDAGSLMRRQDVDPLFPSHSKGGDGENDSLSSWTTQPESSSSMRLRRSTGAFSTAASQSTGVPQTTPFDANNLVPWLLEVSLKGHVSNEKITVHVLKCSARHDDGGSLVLQKSQFSVSGSMAIWRSDPFKQPPDQSNSSRNLTRRQSSTLDHSVALADSSDSPSVFSILIFPDDETSSRAQRRMRILNYDYAFDVLDGTQIDAVSVSIGASHPMLNGGTIITTILESIYAFGSLTAREGAILDPSEKARKRNILKHLPAVDFTFGIQNAFIPPESNSYSDDGQTVCVPEMDGLRLMLRVIGGIADDELKKSEPSDVPLSPVSDGIKFVADFAVRSFVINNETVVKEFPELDIFEGTKLLTVLSGGFTGRISSYLRPQKLSSSLSTTGPNIFNPLEAYEIEFSGSTVSLKIKESTSTLGHRRVIIPTESMCIVKIVESVVDMSFNGNTLTELSWDFQGSSPILQVTPVGQSPAYAAHENKEQAALLISALRQGRLQFEVSSVGGITFRKASTSREDQEGLYDWKFFNAIVSPDDDSAERILDVLHDKRTMEKLLQIVSLINADLHKILRYALQQVWRAKEIFDQEGVKEPGKAIPMSRLSRLVSLFLCGSVSQVDSVLPIIRSVVAGDGLDVVKVKELLRNNVEFYDDWAPEIDRGVRWAAVMFGPSSPPLPYVENSVPPLSELPYHAKRFKGIPSAKQVYQHVSDKLQLPLDPSFSNLVARIAPYMSFSQIEYFLEVRSSTDWQPSDLRRLRYVYAVKKRVLEISESYGGLSFLPQSFLVSVFLGEATRTSLRATSSVSRKLSLKSRVASRKIVKQRSTLYALRRKRIRAPQASTRSNLVDVSESEEIMLTPAGRVASKANITEARFSDAPDSMFLGMENADGRNSFDAKEADYEMGDSLLGPADVAILLQAGLTSAMKGSTVVQLNQRMLLDLIASQPRTFAVAVLAEIGTPGGQGSRRALTSALMALLDLEQSSFTPAHRLDMHVLMESWLPGFKIPRREDYLAGGRWARQSYYEAVFAIATDILEDAECYMALKGHIQHVRHHTENDPIPGPRENKSPDIGFDIDSYPSEITEEKKSSKLTQSINLARQKIDEADQRGCMLISNLINDCDNFKESDEYRGAIASYNEAFAACAKVLDIDKLAFQADWFRSFYQRNYDALMIQLMYDNIIQDVDDVREWFDALRRGAQQIKTLEAIASHRDLINHDEHSMLPPSTPSSSPRRQEKPIASPVAAPISPPLHENNDATGDDEGYFAKAENHDEQEIIDTMIDVIIFNEEDRKKLKNDPLVRLLIRNAPGRYNFTIVTAMGVITEGKKGLELSDSLKRIEEQRGVLTIRADTATARSLEYNAKKIVEAIETATDLHKPYGLVGYSQGCANALTAESLLLSGSPVQQSLTGGLVCRQLLFSAANGSVHGPAVNTKVQRLIVMCEEFFKYQQGYFSRALTSSFLEGINSVMDSAAFHKFMGGAQTFLPEGIRSFWREAQHLPTVPTCTLRGVLEDHTMPECLEMVSHLLAKQAGSPLHDSQVHVYDAVGYPVYTKNRNGRLLENCAVGNAAVQRTHHWSPLSEEVEFMATDRDRANSVFACAKDRHIFPWVDVNARFGVIKYADGTKKHDNISSSNFSNIHARALSEGGSGGGNQSTATTTTIATASS